MMKFGDPQKFAIEVLIDEMPPQGDVWGTSCIHLSGVTIGDLTERHCGLAHFTFAIREHASRLPMLRDHYLNTLSDVQVFEFLDRELYRDEYRGREGDVYWRFDFLTNVGEHFDDWKTFLFARDEHSVTILAQDRNDRVQSFTIDAELFITVVRAYGEWFDAQIQDRQSA
jgi:hypothetical protein